MEEMANGHDDDFYRVPNPVAMRECFTQADRAAWAETVLRGVGAAVARRCSGGSSAAHDTVPVPVAAAVTEEPCCFWRHDALAFDTR